MDWVLSYPLGSVLYIDGELCGALFPDVLTTEHIKSFANDFESLLIARLGLGIFEAAFGPSVVLYLCMPFYHRLRPCTDVLSKHSTIQKPNMAHGLLLGLVLPLLLVHLVACSPMGFSMSRYPSPIGGCCS